MTSDNKSIDKLTKRPIQYWFEDGISELVTGGLFALTGIYFVLQATITHPGWLAAISILSVLIIGGGVIVGRMLIAKLKERLVYPRTGYVTYPKRHSKGKLATTIGTAIAVFATVLLLASTQSTLDWTLLVIGIICGALMLYQAYQTGITRLFIEAVLAVLIGATIAILGAGDMLSSGLFFVIYGLVIIFAGGCALRSYLQKAPPHGQSGGGLMSTDIREPIRRTQAYWYVDGLFEIGTSVFLMLWNYCKHTTLNGAMA